MSDSAETEIARNQIERAEAIARAAHAGQVDKAGADYMDHVLAVAQAVAHKGVDHHIVALLHDTLEDCDDPSIVSSALIADAFGTDIAAAVDAMTKRPHEDYITGYIARVLANPIAADVKRADLSHNMGRLHQLEPAARTRLEAKYAPVRLALGLQG